jgi:hypothetical protein
MKKVVITILVVILLSVGIFGAYEYVTEPKIVDGVMSKNIDAKGKPGETTTVFSPDDTIYFSAEANRFWINKAEVVWYKGEIETANRLFVEKEVDVNKEGYFTAKLSKPEGLEEGHYSVTIYVDGKKIRETDAEFTIKN